MFNNDVRLRALRTLSETLSPIEQKKAIVYFSAGMQRSGQDNLVELRAAVNASVRAHVAIYPIDVRGLQAVVPGGDARQASGRGQGMFSGRGMQQQFSQLAGSQDTLVSLAGETGGRAFTDSNDFGEAFTRVQRDMSAYYLLGYSSTNPAKDGRFRRVQVRVKREGLRVEARAGYYAARDFAHTNRGDRETQLQEQLFSEVSATDVPVLVTGGFFRLAADRYYVPITVAIPGSAVTVPAGKDKATLDVLGMVRDEQGRPLGRIRQTMDVAAGASAGLESKQVLYQTAVTLPPGRFALKVVVRENVNGADRLLRDGGRHSRTEAGAGQGQLGGAEHAAAAAGVEGPVGQSAGARRHADRAERDPRRRAQPEAVLLFRGLRAGAGRRRSRRAREPGVLSRQDQGARDADRRARRRSTHPTARRRCSGWKSPARRSSPGSIPVR